MSMKLENQYVRVDFTERGIICNLFNKRTGHNYINGWKDLQGWKVILPQGDWLDFPIEAVNQTAKIDANSDKVSLQYDHLKTSEGTLNIILTMEYTLQKEQIHTHVVIENRSKVPISEFWFPRLQGLQTIGGDPTEDYLLLPERMGERIQNPLAHLESGGPFWGYNEENLFRLSVYPAGHASMKWMGFFNPREGIYLGYHSDSVETMSLYSKLSPKDITGSDYNSLEMGLIRYPFIDPGERCEFDPFVIALVDGDWHQGAHIYRKAVEDWYKPVSQPDWIKNSNGWQISGMKHQFGKSFYSYHDLLKVYNDAQTGGISELFIFGWWAGGMDNLYPDYEVDEKIGGKEVLKHNLEEIKKKGGHTILYTNGRLIDPQTSFYHRQGKDVAIHNRDNIEIRESYCFADEGSLMRIGTKGVLGSNLHPFAAACPNNKAWFEQMHKQTEIVWNLGANGILWDQLAATIPYLCFSKNHNHNKPAQSVGPGNLHNVQEIRREFKVKDPNFAFITEGVYDAMGQYIDMFHGLWRYSREYPALSQGFKDRPRMGVFPEMFRYTFPEVIMTDRVIIVNDITETNWAFLLGMRFDLEVIEISKSLEDAPEFANYLRNLSNLRSKLNPYLLQGTFIDTCGFKIDNPQVLAKGFRSTNNSLAVVLWNPTSKLQNVSLKIGASKGFKEYTPEGSEIISEGVIQLNSNSIKVAIER